MKYVRFASKLCLLALLLASMNIRSTAAMEIQVVESPGGIKALLVEDYTLPLVALSFSFDGGAAFDPAGKAGTVRLLTTLLDEGAGGMDSQEFQGKMEELGLQMGFSASRDSVSGRLKVLRSNLEPAIELLRVALSTPDFDQDAIERMRDALKASVARNKKNPSAVAGQALRNTLFEGHTYARNVGGTEQSLDAIKRSDIVAMHRQIIVRDRIHIGVVGAVNAKELETLLDQAFADLPKNSDIPVIPEISPRIGEKVSIDLDVPNVSVSLVYPGIRRTHKDYFAAYLLSHILGGGGFSSRLYQEVREKRGLAYGVWADVVSLDHTAYTIAGTSTRAETGSKAREVVHDQINKIAREGVTQEELEAAKKYVIGSYAIRNLDTSGKIASVLVALQSEALGLDYITTREVEISGVTIEQVNRLAREIFSAEPTVVIVGPEGAN